MDKKKDSIELVGSTLLLIFTGIAGIVIWMLWGGGLAGIVGVIMSLIIFSFISELIEKAFEKAKPAGILDKVLRGRLKITYRIFDIYQIPITFLDKSNNSILDVKNGVSN